MIFFFTKSMMIENKLSGNLAKTAINSLKFTNCIENAIVQNTIINQSLELIRLEIARPET